MKAKVWTHKIVRAVSIEFIYGRTIQDILLPEGFEAVGFREPKLNDVYLGKDFRAWQHGQYNEEMKTPAPRVILHAASWLTNRRIDVSRFSPVVMVEETVTISPYDVYRRNGLLKAPDGFEFTGEFRPPKAGEWFLSKLVKLPWQAKCDLEDGKPRWILRPVRPLPLTYSYTEERTWHISEVYPSTGEALKPPVGWLAVAFRVPEKGEHFYFGGGAVEQLATPSSGAEPKLILRRVVLMDLNGVTKISVPFSIPIDPSLVTTTTLVKHTISTDDVYKGVNWQTPPEGYEFTGPFRPPLIAEIYLGDDGVVNVSSHNASQDRPRIILRKKPEAGRALISIPHVDIYRMLKEQYILPEDAEITFADQSLDEDQPRMNFSVKSREYKPTAPGCKLWKVDVQRRNA